MTQDSKNSKFAPFFKLISTKFNPLPSNSSEDFHFWYGNKSKVIQLFKGMSFPSIEMQEKMGKIKQDKLLVLCSIDQSKMEFYGATIFKIKSKEEAVMLSFAIHPDFRNQEYGKRLMEASFALCKVLKLKKLEVKYRTYWKSNEAWEKLLNATGWSDSILQLYYFTIPDIKTQFDKDWFRNSVLDSSYSVEEWSDSSFDQLKETLSREDWQDKVPGTLSPFQLMDVVLPHASLLLKKNGEIVGWLICHLLQKDIIQATTLYVHPQKAKGQGMALIAESSKRRKLGFKVIFMVEKYNYGMLNLVRKHFSGGSTNEYKLLSRTREI